MTIAPWFPPSILALVLWGVSTFLLKPAVRRLPPLHLIIYSGLFFLAGAVAVAAFDGFRIGFDPKGVLLAAAVGIAGTVAIMLYLFAIRHGQMSHATIVSALYPVVTTLLAFFVLDEKLTARQIAGIILGICSLILMVVASDDKTEE